MTIPMAGHLKGMKEGPSWSGLSPCHIQGISDGMDSLRTRSPRITACLTMPGLSPWHIQGIPDGMDSLRTRSPRIVACLTMPGLCPCRIPGRGAWSPGPGDPPCGKECFSGTADGEEAPPPDHGARSSDSGDMRRVSRRNACSPPGTGAGVPSRLPVLRTRISVLILPLLVLALCCAPALAAGYTYLDTDAQPSLVAYTEGDVEYYPGDTFAVPVVLANRARDTAVEATPLLASGIYDPSAALGVTVRPNAGDSPVTIKSLPVDAGDIGSGDLVPVVVQGTVHQDADPGVYVLILDVSYQYVYAIPMVGEDYTMVEPLYREKTQALPAAFRVLGEVRPAIVGESAENLVPDTQGYLGVEVENAGLDTGTEVTLRVVPADNTTFQMVDDSVYIARFEPGDVVSFQVRIAVADDTGAGSYPATLEGVYRDAEGIFRSTKPVPLGIPVSRGAVIETRDSNLTLSPNGEETITVTFCNTGDVPAYDAQARIIGSEVIQTVVDSATLGTVRPGEEKTAEFVISSGAAIAGKQYVLDSEVKYRDELGALMLSDKMTLGIAIVERSGLDAITSSVVAIIVITGAVVLVAYTCWKLKGRKKGG